MFFIASKLFWLVFEPSRMIVWLALTSAVLLALDRRRWARRCATACAAALLLLGAVPILPTLLLRPLEERYSRPGQLAHVDGIVVLGGGARGDILATRHSLSQSADLVRMVAAYRLARRYPAARVVFTGGSRRPSGAAYPEAAVARDAFAAMGLAPSRLTLEGRSRNTWQNLLYTKRIVQPKPGQVWVLATSAFQMPRAMAVARRLGWTMVPWPTDYRTLPQNFAGWLTVRNNLEIADLAAHEWIGLAIYRLSGRGA